MPTFLRNAIFVLFLPLLLFSADIAAGPEPVRFEQGRELLNDHKYLEAEQLFSELYSSSANPELTHIFLFYKAKAAYYAKSFKQSLEDFEKVISEYPKSPYVPYSYLFAGNIYFRQGNTKEAIDNYINSYSLSSDSKLDETLLGSIESIVSAPQTPIADRINIGSQPEAKKCELALALARGLMAQGNFQAVNSILAYCPAAEASKIKADAELMMRKEVEIGLVLPLSGELQKYGESILDGSLLRAGQYVRETGKKLKPVMYDTKGESIEAGRIIRRLFTDGATAVIGPLTSEETAVASATLYCSDLPMIAPAASQGGLTELSSTCFQLQPSIDRQGTRMAEFAFGQMGFDTAAIMTPTTADNLTIADAFAGRFKELGGTILGIEYFRPRETDFGQLITDIKTLSSGKISDSAVFLSESGDTIAATEAPASVECLFIPAEPAQLQQLLPQINFYNLKTTYLGGEGWGDKTVLGLGQEVIKTCYFASARMTGEATASYKKFKSDFNRKYKRDPGYLEALGFDAMSLICQALKADKYSRSDIAQYLSGIANFHGMAGLISFDRSRQNIVLSVYTIQAGEPKLMKEH